MNLSPIKSNYAYMSHNNTRNNINRQTSFHGMKPQSYTKNAAGCIVSLLLLPLALLSGLFKNKKDEIETLTWYMLKEYKNHLGRLENFQNDMNEMNKIIDKHTINDSYAKFTKEAIAFLQTNFKNAQGPLKQCYRLEVFEKDKHGNLIFLKFMDTIKKSAIVAVSKKYKDIDIDELDRNIKEAREIMKDKTTRLNLFFK